MTEVDEILHSQRLTDEQVNDHAQAPAQVPVSYSAGNFTSESEGVSLSWHQHFSNFLTRMVVAIGRFLAMITVAAVALSTTAAGLGVWWYVTYATTPIPSLQGVDSRVFLGVYILLMVCPWWAVLAIMFHKLNWFDRTRPAKKSAIPAAPIVRHASASAG